jgi:hypothetical protein
MITSRLAAFSFAAAVAACSHPGMATAAAAECPAWSSVVCLHWALGPPAVCTEYGCAATKGTDPPKSIQGSTGGGKKNRFPIVTTITNGLKLKGSAGGSNSNSAPSHTTMFKKNCLPGQKCF